MSWHSSDVVKITNNNSGAAIKLVPNSGSVSSQILQIASQPNAKAVFIKKGSIENTEWLTWEANTNIVKGKLQGEKWVQIDPDRFTNLHPLDLGNAVLTGAKEDLEEIQVQYEEHIKSSPWLQKLRQDYDDAMEQHKLFDAIKGENNA